MHNTHTLTAASLALAGVFVSTPCAAKGYALNDTGELMCEVNGQLTTSCAGTGTDAAYGRDVKYPSNGNGLAGFNFTKLAADGTVLKKSATQWACVKDNVNGLVWENKTSDGGIHDVNRQFNYTNAPISALVDASNQAALCGFSDWRVPSRRELVSIFSYDPTDHGRDGFIDNTFFNPTVFGYYWTSSQYNRLPRELSYWTVDFKSGFNLEGHYTGDSNNLNYARIVRSKSNYGVNAFEASGDEVIDHATKLVWKRCTEGQQWSGTTCLGTTLWFTMADALARANALAAATGQNWRVPNVKELDSIVDIDKKAAPAIDKDFFPAAFNWTWFWAVTTGDVNSVAYSFRDGEAANGVSGPTGLRLVRDLEP
jgi:hypothetical protein